MRSHANMTHEPPRLLAGLADSVLTEGQELAQREVTALSRGDEEEGIDRFDYVGDGCFSSRF